MSLIELNSISKCYRIYNKPQDRFKQSLSSRFNLSGKNKNFYKEYWALNDISFSLNSGDSLGIIGENGSGKSTLLQIMAGTIFPTSGTIKIPGRITALLELGSGFNQEFTGRENIFLNGQILGLTTKYIEEKYDEILSFADIGAFINQPIKTYSSGMMMRLAFAVQTALEPDILIVDEALSVGDMFFQEKCFARIKKLLDHGVTFIFVSHDTGSIQQLCKKSLFLENGRNISFGDTKFVTDLYVNQNKFLKEEDNKSINLMKKNITKHKITKQMKFSSFRSKSYSLKELLVGKDKFDLIAKNNRYIKLTPFIENIQIIKDNKIMNELEYGDKVVIRVLMKANHDSTNINLALKIRTLQGTNFLFMDSRLENKINYKFEKGKFYLFNWQIQMKIMHGEYFISINLANPPSSENNKWNYLDVIPAAYKFKMLPRKNGMIDGLYANSVELGIDSINNY